MKRFGNFSRQRRGVLIFLFSLQVDGNLSRADKDSTNNNFMENSIGKFAPYAAQKLKLASRAVLKEAEPKKSE